MTLLAPLNFLTYSLWNCTKRCWIAVMPCGPKWAPSRSGR